MAQKVAIYDTIPMQNIIFFWKTGPNRANQDQTGSNSAKLEPTGPSNRFHINHHKMDNRLNKEKMKQIYGIGLTFEIHGICYRVRHIGFNRDKKI